MAGHCPEDHTWHTLYLQQNQQGTSTQSPGEVRACVLSAKNIVTVLPVTYGRRRSHALHGLPDCQAASESLCDTSHVLMYRKGRGGLRSVPADHCT
mmetsp:Transcript_28766/g.89704  ORF Transcript_28766/g.89704 Transcript_28766/m.89704 type:complete len:96 (-) Transcript_28766:2829-3116(-)